MADATTYRLDKFGAEGVVTDLSPDQLKTSQLAGAENMVLPDAIPTERGGWDGIGETGALDHNGPCFLQSVMATVNQATGATEIVVTGQGTFDNDEPNGRYSHYIGKATTGDPGIGAHFPNREGETWARAYYRGEVLSAPRSGRHPIIRWAHVVGGPGQAPAPGSYSIADGDNQAVGFLSNFAGANPVGSYLGLLHRIVSVPTAEDAGLASKADQAITDRVMDNTRYARIGLKTLVTSIGRVEHKPADFRVLGTGTQWRTAGPGFGAVMNGDWLVREGDTMANALRVTAVISDTELAVISTGIPAFTDAKYVILRPAVGKEVCVHENAPWIAGVDWARSTVYTAPAGYELAHVTNGRFGKTIQADEAMRLFEIPVPSPDATAEIMALLSTPWGLLVCKSDSLHRITGQYPALDVRPIADLGTVDQRAAISVDDMAIIAGREGIHAWRGGAPVDLSDGRRGEWRAKIAGSSRCVLGAVRGHLFVSFDAYGTTPECWVYDLRRGVHLGNFTSPDPALGIESAHYMHSARIPGEPDRLLFVVPSPVLRRVQDAATTIIEAGGVNEAPATNLGPLVVWSGTNAGGPLSRMRRTAGAKVTYTCEGAAPGVLALWVGNDGAAPVHERDLAATVGGPKTLRVRPTDGNLGGRARSVQIGFKRTGGTSVSRVAVHEVEIVVRSRRPRA